MLCNKSEISKSEHFLQTIEVNESQHFPQTRMSITIFALFSENYTLKKRSR